MPRVRDPLEHADLRGNAGSMCTPCGVRSVESRRDVTVLAGGEPPASFIVLSRAVSYASTVDGGLAQRRPFSLRRPSPEWGWSVPPNLHHGVNVPGPSIVRFRGQSSLVRMDDHW